MAANVAPIFVLTPNRAFGVIDTANTAKDGTGTVVLIFTGGTNGSWLTRATIKAKGTNVATVIRFFLNNGSTNTSAGNNTLIGEMTVAATTLSEVAALLENVYVFDQPIPNGYRIYCTIGTTVAAGLHVCAQGWDY